MTLENQVTSLEISKRLKELGVNQKSLFYWAKPNDDKTGVEMNWVLRNAKYHYLAEIGRCYSAFTVAELGEMLPNIVFEKRHPIFHGSMITRDYSGWVAQIEEGRWIHDETEANLRARLLIHLLENKLITL